jgi:prefoldin subunit 5
MSDIEILLNKKKILYDKIDELNNNINEYYEYIKEIDKIVMKVCKHKWVNEFNGSVERIKNCRICNLEK